MFFQVDGGLVHLHQHLFGPHPESSSNQISSRSRLCLNNETTRKHPEMTGQRQDYKNAAAVLICMDLTAYI